MARKIDALDDLDFLSELEGWSPNEMARTVGKMFKGADRIASAMAEEAGIRPLDTRRVKDLAQALNNVGQALERYTLMYSFVVAQGQTGKTPTSTLDDLLPLLQPAEMRQLQGWLTRLETFQRR